MRVHLHGLRLAVEGDPRAVAAAASLLEDLPPDAEPGPPALRFELRATASRPRPAGPLRFFHGVVECRADGDALVLWDGASRARVAADGRLVEVDVAAASDERLLAQVFLLVALVVAVRRHGLFHLHAGALAAPDGRGLLVAGGAGAGKSTLLLALLEAAGGPFLGDDAVFLGAPAGEPAVLALPRPFHVAPRTAAAFPRLGPCLGPPLPAGEKRALDPRLAWPGGARPAMPLPALLLFPHVAGLDRTVVERIPPADALGMLIESSALVAAGELPGAAAQLDLLRRVADGARASRVALGADLLARPVETAERILRALR